MVVTSDRVEVLIIAVEINSHNVLGVTSERNRVVTFSARVSEDVDKAVVIASSNESIVLGERNAVDVSAISAAREDALDEPSVLGGVGLPGGVDSCGGAAGILLASVAVEEEELVGAANTSEVRAVLAPVDGDDEGVVLGALGVELVVGGRVVDVDVVVVRADCELRAVGGEAHALDPLLRVLHGGDY